MTLTPCAIDGCEKPKLARGWCSAHWCRWRRHGDPLGGSRNQTVEQRVWQNIEVTPACWLWKLKPNSEGYGTLKVAGAPLLAHRLVYEMVVGPIPVELELDHLCRVRHCVNPAHLEPVTHRTNSLRGVGRAAANARKTHCQRGHELAGENLAAGPTRQCKTCHRIRQARYLERKRGRVA